MLNARHGVEPAKMTVLDWQTAERVQVMEEQCRIAYMQGRGIRQVCVRIPTSCLAGIQELIDLRSSVGIHTGNVYLFPSLRHGSLNHITSRQAIDDVCKATGSTLRATDFDHRTITMYAIKDMPEDERWNCYQRMSLNCHDN